MQNKFLSFLGICRKAGKMSIGFKNTAESVKANRVFMILIASDLSEKTEKELCFITKDRGIEVLRTAFSMAELSAAIGIKTGIIAIEDEGFSKALKEKYKGESQL